MWLPEIYSRMGSESVSLCQVQHAKFKTKISSITNSSFASQFSKNCYDGVVHNNDVYLKTFLIAISNIPGAIITITSIDKAGRRNLLGSLFLHLFII